MKCLSVMRLEMALAAAMACAAAHADAADPTTPTGFVYYGNGDGTFGSAGAGYAPGMAGYGATPAMYAGYSGYGYGGPAYAGYGYGGYGYGGGGYGGCDTCGGRHGGRHRHCSFGGNCPCCNNVWDGYCAGDCGYGAGGCGGPVKVHRRHRALGCGAGPCVDAACGVAAACAPRRHHCHLRRRCAYACGAVDVGYGYDGGVMTGPGAMYGNGSAQPNMANPNGAEQLESPAPSLNYDEEQQPMPADDSST